MLSVLSFQDVGKGRLLLMLNYFGIFLASDDADCARVVQKTGTESNRFRNANNIYSESIWKGIM